MTEQLCPACGCAIVGTSHEAEGVIYCCEPCASGGTCECRCCAPIEQPEEKK